MTFVFSERSKQRMKGVHPDLVAVMALALERTPVDFTVLEGLRTLERQKQLVAKGASKTMNSRHLTGHAVDIAPLDDSGDVSWDWPLYYQIAPVVKQAARDLGVDIEWGGDWRTFKDGPHWQLPWNEYAADDMKPRANISGPGIVAKPPVKEDNIFDDDFDFKPAPIIPRPIPTPDVISPPVVEPVTAEPDDEQRKSIWQSKTINAAVLWLGANAAIVTQFWENMSNFEKGLIAVGLIAFAVIFSERIKKWVKGDR